MLRRSELRVRIKNPEETSAFLEFLERRTNVIASRAHRPLSLAGGEDAVDEIELAVVASLSEEAMRMEVVLLVRAWRAARRAAGEDATVELL